MLPESSLTAALDIVIAATAVMNRVLSDAVAEGAKQSVIIATDMGRALYETLDYEVVGYIQKFVPQNWNRADYP